MKTTIIPLIILAFCCVFTLEAKVHTRVGVHIGTRARTPAPVYVVPQRTYIAPQPIYIYEDYPQAYRMPQPVYTAPVYVYPDVNSCSTFSIRFR